MTKNIISEAKIDKMAGLAFQNALRLHFDSITLYRKKSYCSAFALGILAIEELGKVSLLQDLIFYSDYREDKEILNDIFQLMYSHSYKQNSFAGLSDLHHDFEHFYWKLLKDNKLESLKQNSFYVGLERNKKNINFKSKINNPLKISSKFAKRIITLTNDFLLDYVLGNIYEFYGLDSENIIQYADRKLFKKLKTVWKYIGRSTKARLRTMKRSAMKYRFKEELEDYS